MVKVEIIETLRIISFRDRPTLGAAGSPEATLLTPLRPLSSISPVELDISYGIGDDPGDENPEWFLAAVDRDNIPDAPAMRRIASWQAAQNWRSIGTDAGPVQTLTRENAEFFRPKEWLNRLVGDRQRRIWIAIVFNSDVQTLFHQQGVITFVESLLQRTYGDDNAWDGYLEEEISDDEED